MDAHDVSPVCTFLREEGPGLLRAYFRRRAGWADAEDLAQETLIKAWRRCEDVAEASRARAWLFQIARRQFADHCRERREVPTPVDAAVSAEACPSPAPAFRRELGHRLREDLGALPEEQREVVAALLDGERQVEIARRLAMPLSTIKSRAQRGRQRLLERAEQRCVFERDAFGRVVDCEPRTPACCA
ncbi:MAG: RNA polymerase sigma-70 factor ECF subfamily [Puniceicoccaceae bacterium 5H]|nr:MAG: RNA polymerase sigma-70 factor ECF subfamily [Puniceicoccaceae bacterium 5H]